MQLQNQMNQFNQQNQMPVQNNIPAQDKALKQKNKYVPVIVILAIVAVAGLGFGGYELWQNMQKDEEVKALQAETDSLKEQETIQVVQEGLTEIIEENTSETADYIYIGEWGIKIKKPEGIYNVGYIFQPLTSDGKTGTVYITGTLANVNYFDEGASFPEYAAAYRGNSLSAISRGPKGFLNDCKTSCGSLVTMIDDYEYTYSDPQGCQSSDSVLCQNEELPVVNKMKETLTNSANFSKF